MSLDILITGVVTEAQLCRGAAEGACVEIEELLSAAHPTDADPLRRTRIANADNDLRYARQRIDAGLAKLATLPSGLKP